MATTRRQQVSQSLWMLVAGLAFALMTQCIKVVTVEMGVAELTIYRSLGGLLIMGALLRSRGIGFRPRHYRLHLLRSGWGLAAIMMFYYAISQLPPTIAYAFNFTSPLFFIVLVAVMMHERLGWPTVAALVGSFCGVLLLLDVDLGSATFTGSLVGIVSGLCAGCAFFYIRRLGAAGEGSLRTVFYFNLHGIGAGLALLAVTGGAVGLGLGNILPVLGVIACATVGQMALTRALHRGPSGASAALNYSGILFSLVIDAGIRGIGFSLADYAGIALVVGCGAAALLLARRQGVVAEG